VIQTVHAFHREMRRAVERRDPAAAVAEMERLLDHGAEHLRKMCQTM
jgi:DNA-binding FadR family transcriptional regulator